MDQNSSNLNNSESRKLKKKQFRKSHNEYMDDFAKLKEYHQRWRKWTQNNKRGFFPIFSPAFAEKMGNVSGNAIKLYIFLGMHIDNQAGYTLLSIDKMAEYFNTSNRTIHNWLRELKTSKLILRVQPAFKQPTYTFLLPYHEDFFRFEGRNLQKIIMEYNNEETESEELSPELAEILNIFKDND